MEPRIPEFGVDPVCVVYGNVQFTEEVDELFDSEVDL